MKKSRVVRERKVEMMSSLKKLLIVAVIGVLLLLLQCTREANAADRSLFTVESSSRTESVIVVTPDGYNAPLNSDREYPLVLLLHGRQDSRFVRDASGAGPQIARLFRISDTADDLEFMYANTFTYTRVHDAYTCLNLCQIYSANSHTVFVTLQRE